MELLAVSHVHSNWSYDGSWTLEELGRKFGRRGCHIVMMTEHDRGFSSDRLKQFREACQQATTPDVLVVPGIEYSDAQNRVHVLVWGPVPFLGENLPTLEMLRKVRDAGGLAVLAHPSRREAWKNFNDDWAEYLLGIEIWNRKYDGWAPSQTAPSLLKASSAIPFVGLDFHTIRQTFPLTMAVELAGEQVNEQTVLACLRSRHCHAQVFGFPLNESLVYKASPVLGVAEQGRRMVASIARHAKPF